MVSVTREVVETVECAACSKTFSGEYVVIEIKDTGPGIKFPRHVFDYGYTTKKDSSGIGLYAVRSKTHIAHGHITIDTSNQGTAFKVYLPLKNSVYPQSDSLLGFLKGNVILLIEDSSLLRSILEILKNTSMKVVDNTLNVLPESIDLVIYNNKNNNKNFLHEIEKIRNEYPFAQILCLSEISPIWGIDEKIFCISSSIDSQDFINLLDQILR